MRLVSHERAVADTNLLLGPTEFNALQSCHLDRTLRAASLPSCADCLSAEARAYVRGKPKKSPHKPHQNPHLLRKTLMGDHRGHVLSFAHQLSLAQTGETNVG